MGDSNERPTRNLQLKLHYGLGTSGASSKSNDEMDINVPQFNAAKYTSKILKESSLEGILKRDNQLCDELAKMDVDLQNMVYGNYNKFITATGTIKKMKDNVENMEDEMNKLERNMIEISKCTNKITESLSGRRQHIEQLVKVNKLLRNIQDIIHLPDTLRKSIAEKHYQAAVMKYMEVNTRLEKYSYFKSFQHIQLECSQIIEDLKKSLKENLKQPLVNAIAESSVRSSASLLRDLHPKEPKINEEIRDALLQPMTSNLEKEKASFMGFIKSRVEEICSTESVLQLSSGCPFVQLDGQEFIHKLSKIMVQYTSEFMRALSILDVPLVAAKNDRKEKVLAITRELIPLFSNCAVSIAHCRLTACLKQQVLLRHNFLKRKSMIECLSLSDSCSKLYEMTEADWKDFNICLTGMLKDYCSEDEVNEVSGRLGKEFIEFLKQIDSLILNLSTAYTTKELKQSSNIVLCHAVVMKNFKERMSDLVQCFPINSKTQIEELQKRYESTIKSLLQTAVKVRGMGCESIMKTGIETTKWLHRTQPQSVSTMVMILVEELEEYSAIIHDALGVSKDPKKEPQDVWIPSFEKKTQDIDNIFNRHIIFLPAHVRPKKLEKSVLIDGVYSYVMKSLLEYCRMYSYNKFSLWQWQIDIMYLSKTFPIKQKMQSNYLNTLMKYWFAFIPDVLTGLLLNKKC